MFIIFVLMKLLDSISVGEDGVEYGSVFIESMRATFGKTTWGART